MKLVRCWPDPAPVGRTGYVVDDCPRLYNTNYSYRGLVALDDDVISLDWDTAVGRDDLVTFAKRCRANPDQVLVVPQVMDVGWRRGWTDSRWNCMVYEGNGKRHVRPGEPTCHLFGFGMVYLPRDVLAAFEARWAPKLDAGTVRFDDMGFAGWHHREVSRDTPIAWEVNAVHLHYRVSEVPL